MHKDSAQFGGVKVGVELTDFGVLCVSVPWPWAVSTLLKVEFQGVWWSAGF